MCAIIVGLLAFPASAFASEAFVEPDGTLVYTAESGEQNSVDITRDSPAPPNAPASPATFTITDRGIQTADPNNPNAPVTIQPTDSVEPVTSPHCESVAPNAVQCTGVRDINVFLGDQDDDMEPTNDLFVQITAFGQAGNDGPINGSNAGDILSGGEGNDNRTTPGGGPGLPGATGTGINGGAGDDDINGDNGNDVLNGDAGNDRFEDDSTEDNGADVIVGGTGRDTADYSGRDEDVVLDVDDGAANDGEAGEGDDIEQVETLIGGSANDTLVPADEADEGTIDGGPGGEDTVDFSDRDDDNDPNTPSEGVTVTLDGSPNDGQTGQGDALNVLPTVDNVLGTPQRDIITGSALANDLIGNAGNDDLFGLGGDDDFDDGEAIRNTGGAFSNAGDTAADDGNDLQVGGDGDDFCDMGGGANGDQGGSDDCQGGTGIDTVTYEGRATGVSITQDGQANDGEPDPNAGNVAPPAEGDNVRADVENLVTGDGFDTVVASGSVPHYIAGNAGQDNLTGGPLADSVEGGTEDDIINTLGGSDAADGGGGDDDIDGGADDDNGQGACALLFSSACLNQVFASTGQIIALYGNAGEDDVFGGEGNDSLAGGPGDNDVVDGEAGDDLVSESESQTDNGADDLNGSAGTDTIDYAGRTNPVTITLDDVANDGEDFGGFPLNDAEEDDNVGDDFETIHTGSGADRVIAFSDLPKTILTDPSASGANPGNAPDGDDFVDAGNGADFIVTGTGDSSGRSDGEDVVLAGGGDDVIETGNDGDNVNGEAGDDDIIANDAFVAGVFFNNQAESDDIYNGGEGDEDNGGDMVTYADRFDELNITLDGVANDGGRAADFAENDNVGPTGNDIEWVVGGSGGDTIEGNSEENTLDGGPGSDEIAGQDGDDALIGGSGADLLDGDAGNDTFDGGAGSDDIRSEDAVPNSETVNCGTGVDDVIADPDPGGDVLNADCERRDGPQGEPGTPGPTGAAGPQGPTGSAGSQGPTGAAGQDGTAGPTGASGSQGPTGAAGQNGTNGTNGQNGAQGPAGQNGAQGPAGPQGPSGSGQPGPQGPAGPAGPAGPGAGGGGAAFPGFDIRSVGTSGKAVRVRMILPASGRVTATARLRYVSRRSGRIGRVTYARVALNVSGPGSTTIQLPRRSAATRALRRALGREGDLTVVVRYQATGGGSLTQVSDSITVRL